MIPDKRYKPEGLKISIENNNGTIRLRYTYKNKRQSINYPLNYFDIRSHQIAKAKATEIHNDIYLYNNYDETKNKYKLETQKKLTPIKPEFKEPTLKEIWEYYKQFNNNASKSSKELWRFLDKTINDFYISECHLYLDTIIHYAKSTLKRCLSDLSAAINLYSKHKQYIINNPFPEIIKSLEVKKNKKIKSFSKEEVKHILYAFKNNIHFPQNVHNSSYSYYYYLIAFRFLTGCRPSEAIALTWNAIIENKDKTWINFHQAYVKGELREGTKNGVDCRLFPVNEQLKNLIQEIPKNHSKLVFPAINGGYINGGNFTQDIWKPLILKLIEDGLVKEYLCFYDQRHTFSTHMARSGKIDLQTLSNIVGNSVPTLIQNYLAVDESLELPELF